MDEEIELRRQMEDYVDPYERDTQKGKYMTFKSGKEFFGLEIQYVNEIIQLQTITAIPETEDYIKGLINLRGKVIPVVDVRLRFKQPPFEYNDRTCIIVISVKSMMVGLIVEQIAEVVEIREENILPPPTFGRVDKIQNKYVYGIGKVGDAVKLLLDPDKLLNDEDLSVVEQASEMNIEEE
ncbi:MAG: chemotaxis protein CheW [Lachnoclostridium sp.]|nr:chemotaxis protein CheW [Lachnospira sp.]MCM1247696.1 chemotaxis protein CheW [Lachnoclostridium sp.]